MEDGRLRRVGHHLQAVDRRERRRQRYGVREKRGAAVESLVERRLDRDDERVHRHEVAALPALPDARLGDDIGVPASAVPAIAPRPL